MKVHIDPSKCDAYGTCAELLPHVFKLDEWGYAYVEDEGEVPGGMEDRARKAVSDCPASAITSTEEKR